MIDLIIYDTEFNGIGIVDEFKSLIWTRKYFEAGIFELYAPATSNNIALLNPFNIIVNPENEDDAGYIQYVEISEDENGLEMMAVKGHFLTYILSTRAITRSMQIKGSVEDNMRNIVRSTFILNDISKIPNMVLDDSQGYTVTFNGMQPFTTVYEYLCALSKASNLRVLVQFEPTSKLLIFKVKSGVDRSINQNENPQVIFSHEYDTLKTAKYTVDKTDVPNVIIAVWKERPSQYKVVLGTTTGYLRVEKYVVSDTCVYVPVSPIIENGYIVAYTNSEDVDHDATIALLLSLAESTLASSKVENFEGDIIPNSSMVYKVDYDLGDIVTIKHAKWNKSISERITEINEVWDNNGHSVTLTFGTPAPTILDIIKRGK